MKPGGVYDNNMKLYCLDQSWRGAIIIAAHSKEEAFNILMSEAADITVTDRGYLTVDHLQEANIVRGVVFETLGDD